MVTIDSQVHCYERNHPGRPWTEVLAGPPEVTGEDMVKAMDAVGVDGGLLTSVFAMYRYDASYALAVHAAHPGRFGLVKPVDPNDPKVAETIARRLRHHATLHGPESIAVVASGEQSNEEAHAWAELVRAAGGGALVSSGFQGADWDALAPYEAPIAELDHADLIVVSGEREVGDAVHRTAEDNPDG